MTKIPTTVSDRVYGIIRLNALRATVQLIALGKRHSNGPIPGREAQEMARRCMVGLGYDWSQALPDEPSPASPETAATS